MAAHFTKLGHSRGTMIFTSNQLKDFEVIHCFSLKTNHCPLSLNVIACQVQF